MLPVPGGGHCGIGTIFVSVALWPAGTWIGPNVCPSTTAVMSSGSGEQLVAVNVSVTGCPAHCRSGLHLRSNVTHGGAMQPTSHCELAVAAGSVGHWFTSVTWPWNVMLPVPGGGHSGIGTIFVSLAPCPASTWIGPNVPPRRSSVLSSGSGEQLTAVQVSVTGCPVHCRSGLHLRSNWTHGGAMQP